MEFYQTSQFGEIVFLKSHKIKHARLDRDIDDKRKVIFVFEESEERDNLSKAYYNHEGKIDDALSFIDEIRHIKALIHKFLKEK